MYLQSRKQKESAAALAVLLVLLLAYGYQCGWNKVCGAGNIERMVRSGKEIMLPHGKVYAEVADTLPARERGLSGRNGLGADEGLLFVFDKPGRYGFWMKDMLFPIDIIWISENGIVVHIEQNISPETYFKNKPPQTFINQVDAKYVLELAAHQAEKYGVYLGVKVKMGE